MTAWLILTFILAAPAWLAIWSRKPTRYRSLAVAAFLIASPLSGAAIFSALGWPVPLMRFYAPPAGEYNVLGVKLVPDVAIYLLLDGPAPRLWVLPWDAKQASKLQGEMNKGEGKLKMRFGGDDESEMVFHAEPQAPAEPKPAEAPGIVYERAN